MALFFSSLLTGDTIPFLIQHPTDHIQIRSIRTTTERTELILPSTDDVLIVGEGDYSSSLSPDPTAPASCLQLPLQLHAVVSEEEDDAGSSIVTLGPGQVVMVPIALLPRFPPPPLSPSLVGATTATTSATTTTSTNTRTVEESPPLSKYQIADWNDIMEEEEDGGEDTTVHVAGSGGTASDRRRRTRRRNNYRRPDSSNDTHVVERYLVSTTILVDTDRGTIEVPLEVSSVRENEYGLPDTLYFDVGGDEEATSVATTTQQDAANDAESERIREALRLIKQAKERDNNRRRIIPTSDHDDVYLVERHTRRRLPSPNKQPSETPSPSAVHSDDDDNGSATADCFDVYVDTAGSSSFHVTQVSVSRPDRVTLHTLEEREDGATLSSPLSRIDGWSSSTVFDDKDDFLLIPADDERHYVVTVCAGARNNVPSEAPSLQPDDIPDWMDDDGTDVANHDENAPDTSSSLGILQVKTSRGPLYVALEKAQGDLLDYLRYPPPLSMRSSNAAVPPGEQQEPPLQSSPSSVDITFYGSSVPSKTIPIQVKSKNADKTVSPFAVMRASVVLDTDVTGWLDVKLVEVRPDELTFECTWNQQTNEAQTIHGAIILRGTSLSQSYGEWKEALDDASADLVEIPLTITILPNARILFVQNDAPQEDMIFPANPALSGKSYHSSVPEHVFRVVAKTSHSSLDVDPSTMTLRNVVVVPEDGAVNPVLCRRFNVTSSSPTRKNDLGTIFVRYQIPKDATFDSGGLPTMCLVRVETFPDAGIHHMQLMVYSGQVTISSDAAWPHARKEKQRTIAGLSELVDWFRNTKAGYSLRSVIKSSVAPESVERDTTALTRYLLSLAGTVSREDWMGAVLHPILLNAGAISQGEVEILPVFVSNNNPIPLTVSIDVGEVEGMGIELGRDEVGSASHVLDFLPSLDTPQRATVGRFQGHPVDAMERFLSESEPARAFFEKLPYREDVFPNFTVLQRFPLLEKKYRNYGAARLRRAKVPHRLTQFGWNECDSLTHPPPYGAFKRKLDQGVRKLTGPIIISSDRKTVRALKKCWHKKGEPKHLRTDESKVLIPPGGVARFDVKLLAPPSSVLEKDITQFVTTGLVLSTDVGETIAVAATFNALQGNLEVHHIPSAPYHSGVLEEEQEDGAIMVPVGLFGSPSVNASSSIRIPPQAHQSVSDFTSARSMIPRNTSTVETGISLFMKSSFYRDIRLRKVISCNPWFDVSLSNDTDKANFDPFLGVHIGAVSNMVSCDPILGVPRNKTSFPSFYRCALSWVTRRLDLQPKGCGTQSRDNIHETAANGETSKKFQQLVRTLRRAILVSEWVDSSLSPENTITVDGFSEPVKSGRRGHGGAVSPLLLDSMIAAWSELHRASDAGLLKLGTSLHALVEYESTPEELSPVSSDAWTEEDNSHLLSLAIRNVSIASVLKTPSLLNVPSGDTQQGMPVLHFPPTHVSAVSTLMIPVRNPTAVPMRIRLAVSNRLSADRDYDGRLADFDPPFVHGQSHDEQGPLLDANMQWWERAGAFVNVDYTGDVIRSHCNTTITQSLGASISFMNPSYLSSTAFVVGCGNRCGLKTETQVTDASGDRKITSPIGASAAAGSAIFGRTWHGGKSRSFFDDDDSTTMAAAGNLVGGLQGPSPFAIPYSSFDEIIVPPFTEATLGPVLFRPPGRTRRLGCAALRGQKDQDYCKNQLFETIVFLENSLSGLELMLLRGKSIWESVVFFSSENEDGGDIEVKNGRETLVFPGYSDKNVPVVKEFVLHNNGDTTVVLDSPRVLEQRPVSGIGYCDTGSFRVLECHSLFPLLLDPGQNSSVKVAHFPQCTKRKEHVSIAFYMQSAGRAGYSGHPNRTIDSIGQFSSVDGSEQLQKRQIRLVLGYEMSGREFNSCTRVQSTSWVEEETSRKTSKNSTMQRGTSRLLRHSATQNIGRGSVLAVAATGFIGFAIFMLKKRVRFATLCFAKRQNDPRARVWEMHTMCLAKLDPASSELQHVGRERSHEIMQSRFQLMKLTVPQSLRRSALLGRDGSGGSNHVGAAGNKKRRGVGSERVRTSEGIFGTFHAGSVDDRGKLPLQLGWRVAGSRGIITPSSFDDLSLVLETHKLVENRKTQSHDREVRTRAHGSKPASLNESLASSYDELTDEDDIPCQELPASGNTQVPVTLPKTIETRSPSTKKIVVEAPDIGWTDARAKNKSSSRVDGATLEVSTAKRPTKKSSIRKEPDRTASHSSVGSPAPTTLGSPSTQSPLQAKRNARNRGRNCQDPNHIARKPTKPQNAWNGFKERDDTAAVSAAHNEQTQDLVEEPLTGSSTGKPQSDEVPSNVWRADSPQPQPISTPPTPSHTVVIPDSPSRATNGSSSPTSGHAQTPGNMRPPPGLGPPPGFGTDAPFLTPPASELPTLDTISTSDMLLSNSAFMNTPLQPTFFDSGTTSPLVQPSNTTAEEEPYMKEFDVMDFLDDILDEDQPTTTGHVVPSNHVIPSNPWATTESRAAAYGIPIDWKLDDEEQHEDEE